MILPWQSSLRYERPATTLLRPLLISLLSIEFEGNPADEAEAPPVCVAQRL
jgi:hypothetical protein